MSTPEARQKKNAYMREYYRKNRDVMRTKNQEYMAKRRVERSEYEKARRHNLTVDQYEAIKRLQNNVCASCGLPPKPDPKRTRDGFHIDHDHKCCPTRNGSCGKCVRGLLCARCNMGLGNFSDTSALLEKAIVYLSKSTPTPEYGLEAC